MRIKITLTFLLYTLVCTVVPAQEPDTIPVGIHQAESEYYASVFDSVNPAGNVSAEMPAVLKSRTASDLTHMVYGWHPYWAGSSAYLSYDYEALTHIAYFSYEVDTATGGFTTLRGWDTTPVIDYAHQRGVKVTLTVTNFGTLGNTAILADTVKQWNLIHTLINQLRARNGDGVNFDFESVPGDDEGKHGKLLQAGCQGNKSRASRSGDFTGHTGGELVRQGRSEIACRDLRLYYHDGV